MRTDKNKSVKHKPNGRLIGLHVFGNLYDIDQKLLSDKKLLMRTVLKAVEIAKMKLVEYKSWSFGGAKGGISVMALVTQSHISLHTWKEYGYATVDIYTCGIESDPDAAFDYIVSVLKPKKYKLMRADRSR